EPGADRYADATAVATGAASGAVRALAGDTPIPHELCIADPMLALGSPKDVLVRLGPLEPDLPWPFALEWAGLSGGAWQPLDGTTRYGTEGWEVTLAGVPALDAGEVAGLRARLRTPLPAVERAPGEPADEVAGAGLDLDAAFTDGSRIALDVPFAPFGAR